MTGRTGKGRSSPRLLLSGRRDRLGKGLDDEMARGVSGGRGSLRLSQPEGAAQPQDFGTEHGAPTAAGTTDDGTAARAAWLETIRVMARCMAQQDHEQMMREEQPFRAR